MQSQTSWNRLLPSKLLVRKWQIWLNDCIPTFFDWNHCHKHFTISVNTWASAATSLQSSWMHRSPLKRLFLNEILAWETDRRQTYRSTASVQLTGHLLQHSHHKLSQRLSTIQKNMVSLGVYSVYLSLCRWLTEKLKHAVTRVVIRGLLHKTSLPNKSGFFQLFWLIVTWFGFLWN